MTDEDSEAEKATDTSVDAEKLQVPVEIPVPNRLWNEAVRLEEAGEIDVPGEHILEEIRPQLVWKIEPIGATLLAQDAEIEIAEHELAARREE